MRMRFRVLIVLLFFAIFGTFGLRTRQVSAQNNDGLRVIPLSQSGYEEVHSLAYSSDGQILSAAGLSGIYSFDSRSLSLLGYLETEALVRDLLFLPDSHTLAAGLFDNTIKTWHVPDHQPAEVLSGHQGWVRKISISKDGSLLASASDDDTVRIWKMPAGDLLLTIGQNTGGVRAAAISPDGQWVAGALEDHTVRVWRVADGSLLYTLSGHTDWVRCLTFSPDGNFLASGSFDMNVNLWRLTDGSLVRTFKGHSSSILELAFSPDGGMLASSAVDDTVRLWNVRSGNLIHTFEGYTGFIYALGFSPDGKTLASGSANQLLVWDLNSLGIDPAASAGEPVPDINVQSTSSDCRKCHHTRGQSGPPRVVYMRCEACHPNGVNLVWCPAFPRASQAAQPIMSYTPDQKPKGLPTGGSELAVLIASPANGETLYAEKSFTAAASVTGQVFSSEVPPSAIQVRLDIWSGEQKTASLVTTPSSLGSFKFNLSINPQGGLAYTSSGGDSDCRPCHDEYRAQAALPNGEVRLVVMVDDPSGNHASDERFVQIETSGKASVPVQVVDDLTREPIPDLLISASTVLYEWRARYASAISGSDGFAVLELEALNGAATSYQLSISPQVVNGILYVSQPGQMDLEPGATSHTPVILTAHGQKGQINGTIKAPGSSSLAGLPVKAIQLPAGPVHETRLSPQGAFVFDPVPVRQYLVIPDILALTQQGLSPSAAAVNLIDTPGGSVSINLAEGRFLTGKVTSNNGKPVPFAWLRVSDQDKVHPIDPTTGQYLLGDLPENAAFVTITAPGFYSQALHIDEGQTSLDVQLVPEVETESLAWGSGQISLPQQTNASLSGPDIILTSGWLWGENDVSQPLMIHAAGAQIYLLSGEFAIENGPNQTAWFYLYRGQAQIQLTGEQALVEVQSGTMIALLKHALPMPFDTSAALALHPTLPETPVLENIQPTPGARIANRLEKAGIGVAQTLTFITYFLSLVSLFTIPLFMLIWIKKSRNTTDIQE